MKSIIISSIFLFCALAQAQTTTPTQNEPKSKRADLLRGEYGQFRANNDLLFYHLNVRVDPDRKFLKGCTTIRFRMLHDDNRIQLDLHDALAVDRILFDPANLEEPPASPKMA
ncbi:MAG: peptidase M1, partial [Blastocatellia bacterium]